MLKLRGHGVTADTAAGHLALQQQSGAVVRAAGAEGGGAGGDQAALAGIDFVEEGKA